MAVCAKHMRTERARNDLTYATKTAVEGLSTDTITNANGQSFLTCQSNQLLNGSTPLSMN